jgi:hypothetical protein
MKELIKEYYREIRYNKELLQELTNEIEPQECEKIDLSFNYKELIITKMLRKGYEFAYDLYDFVEYKTHYIINNEYIIFADFCVNLDYGFVYDNIDKIEYKSDGDVPEKIRNKFSVYLEKIREDNQKNRELIENIKHKVFIKKLKEL